MPDEANLSEKKNRGRPKGTGAQRVYEGLRDDILHLRLQPGSNIEEASLEKRFDVSRTPVREALIRLASDGLVTLLPNRGAQVTDIDISDVPQFFEALDVCQRLVLRLAAVRRTEAHLAELRSLNLQFERAAKARDIVTMSEINHDFHIVTASACGNKYVGALYDDLQSIGLRLSRSAYGSALQADEVEVAYYDEVVEHHDAMIDALRRRDPDEAEALARVHTELFRRRIIRAIETDLGSDFSLEALAGQ
jgi:DNA-binding GntR family transcriptional regulator